MDEENLHYYKPINTAYTRHEIAAAKDLYGTSEPIAVEGDQYKNPDIQFFMVKNPNLSEDSYKFLRTDYEDFPTRKITENIYSGTYLPDQTTKYTYLDPQIKSRKNPVTEEKKQLHPKGGYIEVIQSNDGMTDTVYYAIGKRVPGIVYKYGDSEALEKHINKHGQKVEDLDMIARIKNIFYKNGRKK